MRFDPIVFPNERPKTFCISGYRSVTAAILYFVEIFLILISLRLTNGKSQNQIAIIGERKIVEYFLEGLFREKKIEKIFHFHFPIRLNAAI